MSHPKHDNDNVTPFPDKNARRRQQRQKETEQSPPSEPILNLPPFVKWLSITLITIHIGLYISPVHVASFVYTHFSFVPVIYTDISEYILHALYTPLSHMFLHAGWLHLIMNIGMLLAFGSAIEKFSGARVLILIFAISGLAGAAMHLAFFWGSAGSLIGASGGISGIFGALLRVLQDQGRMKPGWRGLLPLCALWIGISVLFAILPMPDAGGDIAWTAHTGGFIAGLLIYPFIKKRS